MKGRQWRHFCVEWPHMVAGLFGPTGWRQPPPPAPTSTVRLVAMGNPTSAEDGGERSDGSEAEGDSVRYQDGPLVHDPAYRQLFGNAFVEDAVLRMFCQAAKLNELLFGDNKADTEITSQTEAEEMAQLARVLVDSIQVLLGAVHNTKLHRLAHHLLEELQRCGNLWEGDTSINESNHLSVKAMFRRSTRSGPSLMLQMLRAAETQSDVLRTFEAAERDAEREADVIASAQEAARAALDGVEDQDLETTRQLHESRRGVRVSLATMAERPGLAELTNVLSVPPDSTGVMANTIVKRAVFEWGASGVSQYVRGAVNFRGGPWYSHIRYRAYGGETRWGMVNVVLRAVAGVERTCGVVQCMRPAAPREGCVLTEFGCQRLAWDFAAPTDEWPRLEAVQYSSILRLEQVHVDWQDLVGRHGIFAMPSNQPRTAEERRASRYFTNVFYPWTSRPQRFV